MKKKSEFKNVLMYQNINSLTHDMAMIQPLFTSSKWSMGEFFLLLNLSFCAKVLISMKQNELKKMASACSNFKKKKKKI